MKERNSVMGQPSPTPQHEYVCSNKVKLQKNDILIILSVAYNSYDYNNHCVHINRNLKICKVLETNFQLIVHLDRNGFLIVSNYVFSIQTKDTYHFQFSLFFHFFPPLFLHHFCPITRSDLINLRQRWPPSAGWRGSLGCSTIGVGKTVWGLLFGSIHIYILHLNFFFFFLKI